MCQKEVFTSPPTHDTNHEEEVDEDWVNIFVDDGSTMLESTVARQRGDRAGFAIDLSFDDEIKSEQDDIGRERFRRVLEILDSSRELLSEETTVSIFLDLLP